MNVQSTNFLGAQYDFTKMTNAELLKTAKALGSEGKISKQSEAELIGIASGVDHASPNGQGGSVTSALAEPQEKNFLSYLQQTYNGQISHPGSKGAAVYLQALNELSEYQTSSTVETDKSLSTLA